jgi:isocitrate lyase
MKKAIERDILAKDLKNIKEKTNVKKDIARNSAADRRKRLRSHVKHK